MVYNNAISSIKKYPLPIISLQQLKALYGIGELLCDELIKVIKDHYQAFLKQSRENEVLAKEETILSNFGESELEPQTKSVNFNEVHRIKKG